MSSLLVSRFRQCLRPWLIAADRMFRRNAEVGGDIDEEIADHLACLKEQSLRDGHTLGAAEAEALRRFGRPSRVRRHAVAEVMWETYAMRASVVALLLALLWIVPMPELSVFGSTRWQRVSPFTGMRFAPGAIEVRHHGEWWRLDAVDGVTAEQLHVVASVEYGDRAQKRLSEDLYEVMRAAGRTPGRTVTLSLQSIETGDPHLFPAVSMDGEKRRIAWALNKSGGAAARQDRRDKRDVAPYSALRVKNDDRIEVRHDETWWELVSLDGISSERLLATAKRHFPGREQKRLGEDLGRVLATVDHYPGDTVVLVLRSLETGQVREFPEVRLDEGLRRQALAYNRGAGEEKRPASRQRAPDAPISRIDAEKELDSLQALMLEHHSYIAYRGVAVDAAFDAARAQLPEKTTLDALAIRMARLLARFGDGHARIDGLRSFLPRGYTPFLTADTGEGLVAFLPDRSAFVDPARPRLVAIDGVVVQSWIDEASELVADGSPQLVRRRALRLLRQLNYLRGELGLETRETVTVTLASVDGGDTVERTMPVAGRTPTFGAWPRTRSRVLDGGIGYLRIPSMDPDVTTTIPEAIANAGELNGLIVDVRGNGGGSRHALLTLAGMIIPPAEMPGGLVVNAAVYRLGDGRDADHLANRFMYRMDDERWTDAERTTIKAFAESFRAGYDVPQTGFSEWHYLLLRSDPELPRVTCPVVVLMDSWCFSATDIFLAGMKELPGVTLIGEPSSGGSGRSRTYDLGAHDLRVRLSSMISYQVDGELFDGVGVTPDRAVPPALTAFLDGGEDAPLAAALEMLEK